MSNFQALTQKVNKKGTTEGLLLICLCLLETKDTTHELKE